MLVRVAELLQSGFAADAIEHSRRAWDQHPPRSSVGLASAVPERSLGACEDAREVGAGQKQTDLTALLCYIALG